MKRILKSSVFAVIAAMLLSIAGCSGVPKNSSSSSAPQNTSSAQSPGVAKLGTFSLPYTTVPNLNPLLPASQNNMVLWPLLYDCIAEPDKSYNPVKQLASSITCAGNSVTVQLKGGIAFSDGSDLTGRDVVYSYNLVLNHPESPYYPRLSNIAGIYANGLTVKITLKAPDPLFADMLDVPIIKSYSDQTGNAIGSGRYVYVKNGVNAVLTINKRWYKGNAGAFGAISLVNIPNPNAVMSSLSIGEINYVYSDNGGGAAMSFTNTQTAPVNLNRLVFIGVNTSRSHLDNAHYRRALSLSINRKLMVSQTFSNRAAACVLPYNPSWSQLPAPTDAELSTDLTSEQSEMTAAGGNGGTGTAFTLLVDQENQVRVAAANYVANCFSKLGITVTVKAVPFSDYTSLISQGNFDMYIGEVKLQNDMDISPLLAPGGTAAFSTVHNSSALAAFNAWRAGTQDIKSAANAFKAEMPFIPLCYRMGATSYTRGLTGVQATDGDIFFNFENWNR